MPMLPALFDDTDDDPVPFPAAPPGIAGIAVVTAVALAAAAAVTAVAVAGVAAGEEKGIMVVVMGAVAGLWVGDLVVKIMWFF